MSTAQQAAVAAIRVAAKLTDYGVAINGAALEDLADLAPPGDVISGPFALISAAQVCERMAKYLQAVGYIQRALTNAQIGSV